MIRGSFGTRSTASLFDDHGRRDANANICASTKATSVNPCSNWYVAAITFRTFRSNLGKQRSRNIATAKLAAGRSNGPTRGSIVPDGC